MLPKASLPLFLILFAALSSAQSTRHFTFRYEFTVQNVPAGQRVKVWFPEAQSDQYQTIKIISARGDLPLKKTHESKYGNRIFYAEATKNKMTELHFEVVYDVVRREHLTLGIYSPHLQPAKLSEREEKEFLSPDVLVPTTGRPAELASTVTSGKTTKLEKARAIYDYVVSTLRYDKTGTGWGRGDVLWACQAKRGNCTDFLSLFIAMARSQGIPARFEIGFPLPSDQLSGEIPGYHCWAEFFDPQHGWIPVDISEAWKHPEKKDYFFGAHDDNRVQFTVGRDLELDPKQEGKPLNYFVYPYVEIGGKEHPNVTHTFSFADATAIAVNTR